MRLIESERLYARCYTMDDLDDFHRLNSDEEVMRYIRPVKDREQSEQFLKEIIAGYATGGYNLRLALLEQDTNTIVGSFVIIPLTNTDDIQLGYALLTAYWGKGYATEIVKAGLDYAFNVLELASLAAITEAENVASQNVLLKNGFVFEKATEEGEKKVYQYRRAR